MNVLKFFALVLLFPACEQDRDPSSGDAGLPQCSHSPVHVLGGPFDPIWRDGHAGDAVREDIEFVGEATYTGLVNGVATWEDPSGDLPGPIRVLSGLLLEGQRYRIRYSYSPGAEVGGPLRSTTISMGDRPVLVAVRGRLEDAAPVLQSVGLQIRWVATCTSSAGQTCFAPNTHMGLELETGRGELGYLRLGEVTRWVSDLGTIDALLEVATVGSGNENPCSDIASSRVWLTMRAVP